MDEHEQRAWVIDQIEALADSSGVATDAYRELLALMTKHWRESLDIVDMRDGPWSHHAMVD